MILDNQIISRLTNSYFKNEQFSKLSYNNAPKYYVTYLEYMDALASEMDTSSQNVELFLFIFGEILYPKQAKR